MPVHENLDSLNVVDIPMRGADHRVATVGEDGEVRRRCQQRCRDRKDEKAELEELKKKIEEAGMTEEAKEKAMQELHRLEAMPPMSAEGTVSRTYIDWLISVPWKQKSK